MTSLSSTSLQSVADCLPLKTALYLIGCSHSVESNSSSSINQPTMKIWLRQPTSLFATAAAISTTQNDTSEARSSLIRITQTIVLVPRYKYYTLWIFNQTKLLRYQNASASHISTLSTSIVVIIIPPSLLLLAAPLPVRCCGGRYVMPLLNTRLYRFSLTACFVVEDTGPPLLNGIIPVFFVGRCKRWDWTKIELVWKSISLIFFSVSQN